MTQLVGVGAEGAGLGDFADPADSAQRVLRSRTRWRVADQVLSSLTVIGLSFVVARDAEANSFGVFGLALLAASVALGLARAMISDVFVIQFSDVLPRVRHQAAKDATGAAVVLGLGAGALCCLAALLMPGRELGLAVFAIGLALPALLVQDCFRFVFIAAGRPVLAVVLGLACAALQFAVVGLIASAGHDSMFPITLAWGVSALAVAALGGLMAGLTPSLRHAPLWFALNRHLSVRASIEYGLGLGALYLSYCLIGGVVGLAAIGSLWAAQMFLLPAYVLITATVSLVRPGFDRRAARGELLVRPAVLTGAGLAVLAAIWGVVVSVVPDAVGMHLTGQTWEGAQTVLEPAVIGVVVAALAAGPGLALRSLGRGDLLRQVALMQAMLLLGLGILGADLHGVRGAAIGLVGAHAIGAVTVWVLFLTHARRRDGAALRR